MKTPAGKECPHYYANFKRGASKQECRLADANPKSARWNPGDCGRCKVPEIAAANASPHLRLSLTIAPGLLGSGLGRRVAVDAYCTRHDVPIEDPMTGCAQCNAERPGLDAFLKALEEDNP